MGHLVINDKAIEMTVRARCPSCKRYIEVWFEQFCGMRVFRTKNRRNVFQAKCPKCNFTWDSDGRGIKL